MGKVNIVRYIVFGLTLLFGLVTLGISGSLIGNATASGEIPFPFIQLDLAVSVLTLVVVIPPIVVDCFRKGAFTSMVAVEIGWVAVLMILWVAAAGMTTAATVGIASCNFVSEDDFGDEFTDAAADNGCHEELAVVGCAWLNFIILLGWLVTLISLASISHSRGNSSVWKSSITQTNFSARNTSSGKYPKGYETPNTYDSHSTLAQQHNGYSQGYPPTGYNAAPSAMQQQHTGYSQGYPPAGYNVVPSSAPQHTGHPQGYPPTGYNAAQPPMNPFMPSVSQV